MKHITYILYSSKKYKYYIGSTSDDIVERLRKHNLNHKGIERLTMYFENAFLDN